LFKIITNENQSVSDRIIEVEGKVIYTGGTAYLGMPIQIQQLI
jgi:hypothetical protein